MKKGYLSPFSLSLIYCITTPFLFAQKAVDLSGTYEGVRKQFDRDHTEFIETFQYRYDLVQTDNRIEGTSVIYDENGDYGEIKIRGIIVGDLLYFEEYEIVDQIKNPNKIWCYKSGALQIVKTKDELMLKGETDSYMAGYGYPCTGGYTEIAKTDYTCEECNQTSGAQASGLEINSFNLSVYPNPAIVETSVAFTLDKKAKVQADLFDLSGRNVSEIFSGNMKSGNQKLSVNMAGIDPGMYVVKLSVNNQVFSKQIIKTNE